MGGGGGEDDRQGVHSGSQLRRQSCLGYGEEGVVWCDVVWCGAMWCGLVGCGVVWCGVV